MTRPALALAVAAILPALAALAYGVSNQSSAAPVVVREGDDVVATERPSDAARRASAIAGFALAAPDSLPGGLMLKELLVGPPPPDAPTGAITATDRIVSATYAASGSYAGIDFLRDGFNPVASGEKLEGFVAAAPVYWLSAGQAEFYSMLSHNRGVILVLPRSSKLSRADTRLSFADIAERMGREK